MNNERNEKFISPCELVENKVTVAASVLVDNSHPENYYG